MFILVKYVLLSNKNILDKVYKISLSTLSTLLCYFMYIMLIKNM